MAQSNPEKSAWDRASTYFNVHKDTIEEGAADNILIAWPPILSFIRSQLPTPRKLRALDYGCGTGGFSAELAHNGFQVTGIDYAEGMISKARQHCTPEIEFIVSDHPDHRKYDLVSSIMALQFMENIAQVFGQLTQCVESNGVLVFAVFNPDWVKECLKVGEMFSGFDNAENSARGIMQLANEKIPVFIRSAGEYTALATTNGFTPIWEIYPPFTKEFLARYPTTLPTHCSEYLILGFRKQ